MASASLTAPRVRARASALGRRPELWLLLAVALVLYVWALSRNGWANTYYSAAVRSMSSSWHAFLYGSFDASGLMTVDKPPLALWVQALTARIFGFSSWSMLVPQALMGVATVGLAYDLVRRRFGRLAGFVGGLALAVTPVWVAIARYNNPDTLLVLCCVAAVWFVVRGLEDGRTRWIVLAGRLRRAWLRGEDGRGAADRPGACGRVGVGGAGATPPARSPLGRAACACRAVARAACACRAVERAACGCRAVGRAACVLRPVAGPGPAAPCQSRPRRPVARPAPAAPCRPRRPVARPAPAAPCRPRDGGRRPRLAGVDVADARVGSPVDLGDERQRHLVAHPRLQRPRTAGRAERRAGRRRRRGRRRTVRRLARRAAALEREPGRPGRVVPRRGRGGRGRNRVRLAPAARRCPDRLGHRRRRLVRDDRRGVQHRQGDLPPVLHVPACAVRGGTGRRRCRLARARRAPGGGGRDARHRGRGRMRDRDLPALGRRRVAGAARHRRGCRGGRRAGVRRPRPRSDGARRGRRRVAPGRARRVGGRDARARRERPVPVGRRRQSVDGPAGWRSGRRGSSAPRRRRFARWRRRSGGPRQRRFARRRRRSSAPGQRRFAPGGGFAGGPPGGGFGGNSSSLSEAVAYAKAHGAGTVAVSSQSSAATSILSSDASVAGIGGFSGRESEVTATWLADAVQSGKVRWALADAGGGFNAPADGRTGAKRAMEAVTTTCTSVTSVSGLYDCSGHAAALRLA